MYCNLLSRDSNHLNNNANNNGNNNKNNDINNNSSNSNDNNNDNDSENNNPNSLKRNNVWIKPFIQEVFRILIYLLLKVSIQHEKCFIAALYRSPSQTDE